MRDGDQSALWVEALLTPTCRVSGLCCREERVGRLATSMVSESARRALICQQIRGVEMSHEIPKQGCPPDVALLRKVSGMHKIVKEWRRGHIDTEKMKSELHQDYSLDQSSCRGVE